MAWPAATASTRIGVVVFSGSRCTPKRPISPRLHTTLRMPVSIGSTMPCTLRNDQYLDQQDDDERRAEEHRHLHELHVGRFADDGDAAEIDVHVGVALAVDDAVHRLVQGDEVRRPLVLLEVGDHRRGLAVWRDQRVDVDRHRRHGLP